jgi:hypothetical protein
MNRNAFFLAVGGIAADGHTKNFEIKGDTLTQHRCTKVVQRFKG